MQSDKDQCQRHCQALGGSLWFLMVFSVGSQTLCVVFCNGAKNDVDIQSITRLQKQINLSLPQHIKERD